MQIISKTNIFLLFLILCGIFLRTYNIDWDHGYHLHPDEKIIYIYGLPLHSVHTIAQFFSPDSPLNPKFFIYGSLPLYIIKLASLIIQIFNRAFLNEQYIYMLGRFLSAVCDIGTMLFVYFIGKKIGDRKLGLISAFLYTFSVLPIQSSHFYTVDNMVTFFITGTLYTLLIFYKKHSVKNAIFVGLFFGLAISTKYTSVLLSIPLAILLLFHCLTLRVRTKSLQLTIFFNQLGSAISYGLLITVVTIITFSLTSPYILLDSFDFWKQLQLPSAMTHDPFTYPFTLQFVGMLPYWYEIKNIFLWGEGPVLGILSFAGVMYLSIVMFKKEKDESIKNALPFLLFFWVYFLAIGSFAIGFIRYMLPIYPLLAIFAGYIVLLLYNRLSNQPKFFKRGFIFAGIVLVIIWPVSFFHIYTRQNTLLQASSWINQFIPKGQFLLTEVGDIQLPLSGKEKYKSVQITPYDPDTSQKQIAIDTALKRSDYVIIASRRSYIPLPKLIDCKHLPKDYCYPIMAKYYKNLFNGSLGFKKIAEFTDYPQIPLTNISINDESADETFTVFDHPRVMIFKKI